MAARQAYKVFVGNLPWTVGSTELRHFASSFGPVLHSQVVFDKKTGLSKSYGFVTFGNREGSNAILKGGTGTYFLEGHHINVTNTNNVNSGNSGNHVGGSVDDL